MTTQTKTKTDNGGTAPQSRFEFIANMVMGSGLALGLGGLLTRFITYLYPIVKPVRLVEVRAGRRDAIPTGGAHLFTLGTSRVMVVDTPSGLKAFSAVCTHLGCIIKWHSESKHFICPCHKGTFDTSGQVVSGPPPTPLNTFDLSIKGNDIYVMIPEEEPVA